MQQMAPLDRSEKFQIRLTADERRMLDAIADNEGLSASDLVRQLIRQRFASASPGLNAVEQAMEPQKGLARLVAAPLKIEIESKKARAAAKALKKLSRSL